MASQKNTVTAAVVLLAIFVVAAAGWFFVTGNKSNTETSGVATAGYAEGVHYQTIKSALPPSATRTPDDKVSVVEFFWFGCPHCQSFEPVVRQWLATVPEDVAFQPIPVVWNDATSLHAALFYASEGAENAEQLHDKLFEKIIALRPERNLSSQLEQIAVLYTDHGIDESTVKSLVESTAVQARVSDAGRLMKQAEVSSTPTVLVDGRWIVLNNEDVAEAGIFNVVDFLVQKARAAK